MNDWLFADDHHGTVQEVLLSDSSCMFQPTGHFTSSTGTVHSVQQLLHRYGQVTGQGERTTFNSAKKHRKSVITILFVLF